MLLILVLYCVLCNCSCIFILYFLTSFSVFFLCVRFYLFFYAFLLYSVYDFIMNYNYGCIDDERQFKSAKRSQAPGDATVLKRFSAITSLFFVVDRKE